MVPRHALFSLRRCVHTFNGRESIVYKQSMFRRPSTVDRETVYPLRRSCSLIGTVVLAPRKSDRFCPLVYTFLEVEGPSISSTPSKFKILLKMFGRLAEISFKHLKVDDFIYVRGPLSSYEKLNINGQLENMYKLTVQRKQWIASDYGRYSLQIHMNGGTIGSINYIQLHPILDTRTLMSACGSCPMIHLGYKGSCNGMTQVQQLNLTKKIENTQRCVSGKYRI
ncbi:uncharacterized protein LOC121998588 isoform X2 [Zingiber officinale]|uniref:uncharacterized protein LOC121998588 isoform X2 n=1 Tax=Zingiber officinale TaxID=94328 RepID=UPI001C4CA5ED|nr:uncharacterized protein LOC121998588 isoform X2 [Zingiber officinale]